MLEHTPLGLMTGGLVKCKPQNEADLPTQPWAVLDCSLFRLDSYHGGIQNSRFCHQADSQEEEEQSNSAYPVILPDFTDQVNSPTSRGAAWGKGWTAVRSLPRKVLPLRNPEWKPEVGKRHFLMGSRLNVTCWFVSCSIEVRDLNTGPLSIISL